jgi:PBSX family phage terminase large subunit
MTQTATDRPAEHRYRPYGSAAELFAARDPEVLLSGPAGTGKSRACLEKLHAMMLLNPGARGLIVRKTAVSLTSSGLVTFREFVGKEAIASGEVRFYGGSAQEAASYRYGNGSSITIGGLDKATRIMSTEYDVAYVQEATELTEDDWEAITTRLRHGAISFQQIIADCNPDTPHHWLKLRADRGGCRMIYCRHQDNPRLFDAEAGTWTPDGTVYMERLSALTGVRRERLHLGHWAAAEGLVYDEFDPTVHLSTRFNRDSHPPDTWPRYLAVDFGFTNPFVAQWWVEDPDGRLYLYREIYMTRRLVEDHAKQIARLHKSRKGPEPAFRAIVCDHDAEDRATLERHLGCSTIAAHKDVKPGIEAVQLRLRLAGDGKPRLYLCRDALAERDPALDAGRKPCSTIEEITGYVWDPSSPPSLHGAAREAPLKRDDHGMDAARYLVAHIDVTGRPRVRWFTPLPWRAVRRVGGGKSGRRQDRPADDDPPGGPARLSDSARDPPRRRVSHGHWPYDRCGDPAWRVLARVGRRGPGGGHRDLR